VATLAFQPHSKNFYIYSVAVAGSVFKQLPVTHIILENEKTIQVMAMISLEECILLGTDNGVVIKVFESSTS
jgi:hypothetical protein